MVLQIPRGVRAEVPEEVDLWTVAQADWRSAEEAERAGGCGGGGGARNGRPRSLSYPEGPLGGPSSSHRLCRWQLASDAVRAAVRRGHLSPIRRTDRCHSVFSAANR